MAKRVSSTAIGGFVIASLALAGLVAVVLGSGALLRRPHYYICMFRGSLNGLKVGAAVKVNGVQIGTVKDIALRLRPGEGQLRQISVAKAPMPVIIEIDERQLTSIGGKGQALSAKQAKLLVKEGLRAQLSMESLLTGMLYVDLGFHPNTPINLYIEPGTGKYPEIPTVPTDLEQIREDATKALAKLEKVDIKALVESITNAGNAVRQLAGDPDLHKAIDSIDQIVSDPALKATIASAKVTLGNVNQTVIAVKGAINRTSPRLDPLIASLQKSSNDLQLTLAQARTTLATAQLLLNPGSPMTHRLDSALENLDGAARSIHDLADYLQRNPSALIRGRYVSDGTR